MATKQPKTCQQCGMGPLYWTKAGTKDNGDPLWKLSDPATGLIHECRKAKDNQKGEDNMNRLQLMARAKELGLSATVVRDMSEEALETYIREHGGVPMFIPPTSTPAPVPAIAGDTSAGAALWAIIEPHAKLDKAKIAELVQRTVEELLPKPALVEVRVPQQDGSTRSRQHKAHKCYEKLVRWTSFRHVKQDGSLGRRLNVALYGPAGSGKSYACAQLAEDLGLPFYDFTVNQFTPPSHFIGYVNQVSGEFWESTFYRAFKHGGVWLADEADTNPALLLAANTALASDSYTFPNGEKVTRHENCIAVMGLNSNGSGGNRDYHRQAFDGSAKDRWVFLAWDYDEEFERDLWGDQMAWVRYVQSVRAAVKKSGVRHIVSPRASEDGAAALRMGAPRDEVEEMVLWKGLDEDSKKKVLAAL